MQRLPTAAIVLHVAAIAAVAGDPAFDRPEALNTRLRAGEEAGLRALVEVSFTEAMRKAGPADPGILPFLLELSRRAADSTSSEPSFPSRST